MIMEILQIMQPKVLMSIIKLILTTKTYKMTSCMPIDKNSSVQNAMSVSILTLTKS